MKVVWKEVHNISLLIPPYAAHPLVLLCGTIRRLFVLRPIKNVSLILRSHHYLCLRLGFHTAMARAGRKLTTPGYVAIALPLIYRDRNQMCWSSLWKCIFYSPSVVEHTNTKQMAKILVFIMLIVIICQSSANEFLVEDLWPRKRIEINIIWIKISISFSYQHICSNIIFLKMWLWCWWLAGW